MKGGEGVPGMAAGPKAHRHDGGLPRLLAAVGGGGRRQRSSSTRETEKGGGGAELAARGLAAAFRGRWCRGGGGVDTTRGGGRGSVRVAGRGTVPTGTAAGR
jgi:hypothetical protein